MGKNRQAMLYNSISTDVKGDTFCISSLSIEEAILYLFPLPLVTLMYEATVPTLSLVGLTFIFDALFTVPTVVLSVHVSTSAPP